VTAVARNGASGAVSDGDSSDGGNGDCGNGDSDGNDGLQEREASRQREVGTRAPSFVRERRPPSRPPRSQTTMIAADGEQEVQDREHR